MGGKEWNVRKTNCTLNCTLLTQHFVSWILNRLVLTPNSTPFAVSPVSFLYIKLYTFLLFRTWCSGSRYMIWNNMNSHHILFQFSAFAALRCINHERIFYSLDESGIEKTVSFQIFFHFSDQFEMCAFNNVDFLCRRGGGNKGELIQDIFECVTLSFPVDATIICANSFMCTIP